MLADIISANRSTGQVFLLVALILFIIAFVVRVMVRPVPLDMVLVAAGLAFAVFGLMFF